MEQTQKYKFEIWLFKSTILDPRKKALLVFAENPPKNVFFMLWLWFSFKNSRHTNVLLVGIFENAQKKWLTVKKRHFGRFGGLIMVFCSFSKILIKIICVGLLFLKLNQKKNCKKIFFYIFYFKTQKCSFLRVNQFFSNCFSFSF